jgi:hypothetical protein
MMYGGSRTPFCEQCGAELPVVTEISERGWLISKCACGNTSEITTAEAAARQRAALVTHAVMPESPPIGPRSRPVETGPARLRALALDMWRRGVLNDDAYYAALNRIGG